jgi:HEAT repeat protein
MPTFEELRQQLVSSDPGARQRAVHQLGALDDSRAVELLIPALFDKVDSVQIAAAKALGMHRDEQAIGPLTNSLKGETYGSIEGPGSQKQYFEVIKSSALALVQIGTAAAVDALLLGISDQDPLVVAASAAGLGLSKDPRAAGYLNQALRHRSGYVRRQVVKALGKLRDERAIPHLIGALKDPSLAVQLAAIEELKRSNDPRVSAPLRAIYQDVSGYLHVPVVENSLNAENKFQLLSAVAIALARLGDRKSLALLSAVLNSEKKETRYAACLGLSRRKDKRAYEGLIQMLHEEVPSRQIAACKALGHLADKRAILALEKLISEQNLPTRLVEEARLALNRIQGSNP